MSLANDKFITQEQIDQVPESTWYKYTLACTHWVLTRVRIKAPKSFHQHYIRCPQCPNSVPTNWTPVESMEAVSDEYVSDVRSGTAYILPGRILRTDGTDVRGHVIPSGNPLPYSSKDRDY